MFRKKLRIVKMITNNLDCLKSLNLTFFFCTHLSTLNTLRVILKIINAIDH